MFTPDSTDMTIVLICTQSQGKIYDLFIINETRDASALCHNNVDTDFVLFTPDSTDMTIVLIYNQSHGKIYDLFIINGTRDASAFVLHCHG